MLEWKSGSVATVVPRDARWLTTPGFLTPFRLLFKEIEKAINWDFSRQGCLPDSISKFSFSDGWSVSLPERIVNKQEFTTTGRFLSGGSCGTEVSVAGNTLGALSGCGTRDGGVVVWNLCYQHFYGNMHSTVDASVETSLGISTHLYQNAFLSVLKSSNISRISAACMMIIVNDRNPFCHGWKDDCYWHEFVTPQF